MEVSKFDPMLRLVAPGTFCLVPGSQSQLHLFISRQHVVEDLASSHRL